jgi:limonene-1,2-epoxide hydrolase
MNGENDKLIRDFMNAFEKKDVKVLEEFFHPNVVFRNYGDKEVRGREELEFLKVRRQRRITLPKRWSAMSMHPGACISPLQLFRED